MNVSFKMGMDAHLHVRDDARMKDVVHHSAAQFGYGIIMPNLSPKHVTTVAEALAYRKRILAAIPGDLDFTPLMTISLTKDSTPGDLDEAKVSDCVTAVKFYAGHTTNAEGIEDIESFGWAFEILEQAGKPLLLHGEAGKMFDVFDREEAFYETSGTWIIKTFPKLKVVCEHITTDFLAQFVKTARDGVVATITPQHLLSNRNDMLGMGGIRPDYYCMPILKKERDRLALLDVATSGSKKFFLGTDSAPHAEQGPSGKAKYSACGCAGCFTSPYALELYAEAFASFDALHTLPYFASENGLAFYGLKQKPSMVTIEEVKPWEPAERFRFGDDAHVVPYMPFETLRWKVRVE